MSQLLRAAYLSVLVLSFATYGAAFAQCIDSSGGIPTGHLPSKAWIGDCLLHPGTIQTEVGGSCPNVDPYLKVTTYYRCEICSFMGNSESLSATGYGQCLVAIQQCVPRLHSIHYDTSWVRIRIHNVYHVGFCRDGHLSESYSYCGCRDCSITPILISLGDGAVTLTDPAHGVRFDLDSDGVAEQVAWTVGSGDEAFLAMDRNRDGTIGDGSELFGSKTPQPEPREGEPNGFAALAVLDDSLSGGNENGVIDPGDAAYSRLRLWRDANHDGKSQSDELQNLSEARVTSIDLEYRTSGRLDEHGNEFRYFSHVRINDLSRIAWDVVLLEQEGDF